MNPLEIIECAKVLGDDVDESEKIMLAENSGIAKRHYVRAVFAWIEAISHLFRHAALSKFEEEELSWDNIPTIHVLKEQAYTVSEKGETRVTQLKAPTASMLLYSLKAFAESQGLPLGFDKGGKNWQSYRAALRIRNRVTHPKIPSDIELSDENIMNVREAKGMILAYLSIVTKPRLMALIKAHSDISVREDEKYTLTFTEEDLEHFED